MWSSESQFTDSFASYLHHSNEELSQRGKGMVLLREYNPGYGRVNLVLVVYDIDKLMERRKRISCPVECQELDPVGAFAMAYLSHTRWVSLKKLGRVVSTGLTKTRQLVSALESRGLVETRAELVKALTRQTNLVIDYIAAFELKLENWQRALEQAGRHLWFASRSYVVMPGRSEKLARRLAQNCIAWKVGAILCHSSDKWESLTRPPRTTVPTSHIGWLLNESIVSREKYA